MPSSIKEARALIAMINDSPATNLAALVDALTSPPGFATPDDVKALAEICMLADIAATSHHSDERAVARLLLPIVDAWQRAESEGFAGHEQIYARLDERVRNVGDPEVFIRCAKDSLDGAQDTRKDWSYRKRRFFEAADTLESAAKVLRSAGQALILQETLRLQLEESGDL